MKKELYIDGEWFIGGKIFLIGYCFESGRCRQLYLRQLSKAKFVSLLLRLKPGSNIYFYGPDIGVIEKHFGIRIREHYRCINLLKVFRQVLPPCKSYKLAAIEKSFGIKRARVEYKKNIRDIFRDWYDPVKRKRVMMYNIEDVEYLRELKNMIFKKYKVKAAALERMK
jgi:DNA polymerase elongation subunit (family B)